MSHALLPAFTLAWRLDVAETIGSVAGEVVVGGGCGVRPAAEPAGVPYTIARGWVRRFRARAAELGVAFAAVAERVPRLPKQAATTVHRVKVSLHGFRPPVRRADRDPQRQAA